MVISETLNKVNLNKIEILGFKSFPDKTEIVFDSNYTGIVGPNGCGKSNIVDAIRWVFGEGRTSVLRTKKMSDLIFTGSKSRKSFSYCEVSVYINNSPKKYPIEYDEIVITRKLDRTGISDYFINKKKCKQKDIIDLFRDSGVGKDGYSIVGQGQINQILDSNPRKRRAVFEEATGISMQRAQKEETENRLAKARENMLRLNDKINEIELQLTPLKKDAKNAKIVKDLKTRLKILEVSQYVHKSSTIALEKSKINLKKDTFKKEYSQIENELQSLNKAYTSASLDRANMDTYQQKVNNEILELTVNAEKASGNVKVLTVQLQTLADKEKENLELIKNSEELLIKKEVENKNLLAQSKIISGDLLELEAHLVSEESKYQQKKSAVFDLEKSLEAANKMMLEGLSETSEVDKKIVQYELEKDMLIDKLGADKSEFESNLIVLNNLEKDIEKYNENIKVVQNEQAEFNGLIKKLTAEIEALNLDLNELNLQLKQLESNQSNLVYGINFRKEALSNYSVYDDAIQTIMEEGKKNTNFKNLYHGTVAELINVSKNLQVAIEIALGNAIQNIVVDSDDNALKLIEFLKSKDAGRATFLPVSSIKSRELVAEEQIKREKGVIGVASELISYSPKLKNIFSFLLGRIVIVDTKENGVFLSRKFNHTFKIVTIDGEVFNVGGAITGGSIKNTGRKILSQESDLNDLEKKLLAIRKKHHTLSEMQIEMQQSHEDLSAEKKVCEARVIQLDKEKTVLEVSLANSLENLKNKQNELDDSSSQNSAEIKRISELKELIENAKVQFEKISAEKISPDEFITEMKNKLFDERENLDSQTQVLSALKLNKETVQNKLNNIEQVINLNNQEMQNAEIAKVSSKLYLEKIKEERILIQKDIDVNCFNEEDHAKLNNLREELKRVESYKIELIKKIEKLENDRETIGEKKLLTQEKIIRLEGEEEKIDSIFENLADTIMQNYEYDYPLAQKFLTENVDKEVLGTIDYSKAGQEIKQIYSKIERIGPVNELADVQYEETLKRFNEHQEHFDDLDKAEKDMVNIIKKLTTEMSSQFAVNIEKINKHFQEMFKGIFGGGKAYLQLEKDVDILEAGIEIMAQLPDSKLTAIISLSGGERGLIAIAILFAIIKLNPMPFCILDEIDSSLDEANADLLGQYLKKFSIDTQFVIITHRKPTMEQCDVLYGITSYEKGVSKQVRVKLEEAVALASEKCDVN